MLIILYIFSMLSIKIEWYFNFFFLSYLKQKCLFSTYCIRDDYCQRTTKSAKDSDILIDWYSTKRKDMKNTSAEDYITILLLNRNTSGLPEIRKKRPCVIRIAHRKYESWHEKVIAENGGLFSPSKCRLSLTNKKLQILREVGLSPSFWGDTLQRQVYGRRWKAFTKGNKGELVTVSTLFMLL